MCWGCGRCPGEQHLCTFTFSSREWTPLASCRLQGHTSLGSLAQPTECRPRALGRTALDLIFAGTEEGLQSMTNPLGASRQGWVRKEKQIALNPSLGKFHMSRQHRCVDIGSRFCQIIHLREAQGPEHRDFALHQRGAKWSPGLETPGGLQPREQHPGKDGGQAAGSNHMCTPSPCAGRAPRNQARVGGSGHRTV